MSTTTLSLVNATTRPSVMVPSSRFLNVSSYRAAKASRSNCGSLDFETILMGTVLLFRHPSGADDERTPGLTQRCEHRHWRDAAAGQPRPKRQSVPSRFHSRPDKMLSSAYSPRKKTAVVRTTRTRGETAAAWHRPAKRQTCL